MKYILLAETDATSITTAVVNAFAPVATICVAMGTFWVVYRLVRRIGDGDNDHDVTGGGPSGTPIFWDQRDND